MPLMGSLYIGTSGLQTSQEVLNTTGHNITNADTTGYVRQQAILGDKMYNTIAWNSAGISNKQLGLGVTYNQVRQVRDIFLDQTYREEKGRLEFYAAKYDSVGEIENLLGELDGASFEESINDLWVSVQELAKDPNSSVVQGLFMQKCNSFMTDAQAVYTGLCNYQDNLNMHIQLTVDEMNDIGHQIWELNESIRKIEAGGIEHANDLRDQRNQLLDTLSGYADIEYSTDPMGNVLVKLEGHAFVAADRVNELAYQVDETTSFYDVFWEDDAKYTITEDGIMHFEAKDALVFDVFQDMNSALDTDIGKLKSMIATRGEKRANFTDISDIKNDKGEVVRTEQEGYDNIKHSTLMKAMAEFDKLIHSAVSAINGALEDAFNAGDGTYMSDGKGNALQIFHREVADPEVAEDYNKSETLFTTANLKINQELMQAPTKLGFVRPDGRVDYETTEKLKAVFEDEKYSLNPEAGTKLNLNSFYSALVADVANEGAVIKSIQDTQQITVDSTESARQQIIGVSTDEELSNMIRFQNAYNASSRYINVINEMLAHLVNTLGQ